MKLPDWVKPGASFVASHGLEPTHFHIRAIVDDNQVVMRYWRASKQRWQYVVEDSIWFDLAAKPLKIKTARGDYDQKQLLDNTKCGCSNPFDRCVYPDCASGRNDRIPDASH